LNIKITYQNSLTYLKKVFFIIGEQKKKLVFISFIFFINALLDLFGITLLLPFITFAFNVTDENFPLLENLINLFINYKLDPIYFTGILLVIVFIAKAIISILSKYLITKYCYDLQVFIKVRLMNNYSSMEYTKFIKKDSSDYIFNVVNLTGQFSGSVVQTLLQSSSNLLVVFAITTILFISNPLTFLFICLFLLSFIFLYDSIFGKLMKRFGQIANLSTTIKIKAVGEFFNGFKQNYSLNTFSYFTNTVEEEAVKISNSMSLKESITVIPRYIIETLFVVGLVSSVLILLNYNSDPSSFLPSFSLFAFSAIRLIPIASSLTNMISLLRYGKNSVDRLHDDLSLHNSVKNNTINRNHTLETISQFSSCSLKDVCFSYPGSDKKVIEKLNIDFKFGELTGIVGPSGSGKTTIVDLIMGLLSPTSGEILYDGKVNHDLNRIFSSISYQPQDPFVINSSIKANITLGVSSHEVNKERLYESLKIAKLSDFISSLPNGVDTEIGQFGSKLSGGQRQRLGIARSFYFDRKIMIFDECTSSLDNESENEIMNYLVSLKGKVTIIIITHNVNNFKYFDKVYSLENVHPNKNEKIN
jgi:ATP-binding cassette, subfamily B, bacterial PglK